MSEKLKLFHEKLSILNDEFVDYLIRMRKSMPHADFTPSVNDYLKHISDLDNIYGGSSPLKSCLNSTAKNAMPITSPNLIVSGSASGLSANLSFVSSSKTGESSASKTVSIFTSAKSVSGVQNGEDRRVESTLKRIGGKRRADSAWGDGFTASPPSINSQSNTPTTADSSSSSAKKILFGVGAPQLSFGNNSTSASPVSLTTNVTTTSTTSTTGTTSTTSTIDKTSTTSTIGTTSTTSTIGTTSTTSIIGTTSTTSTAGTTSTISIVGTSVTKTPTFSFPFSANTGSSGDATTKPPIKLTFGSINSGLPMFSFGVPSSKSTENATAGTEEAANINDDDEKTEPPKPEDVKQTEEDAVFSCKCVVHKFVSGKYEKLGVGYLSVKNLDGKKQLLIREATTIGRLMANTLIDDNLKSEKVDAKKIRLSYPTKIEVTVNSKDEGDANGATKKEERTEIEIILLRLGAEDEMTGLVKQLEEK